MLVVSGSGDDLESPEEEELAREREAMAFDEHLLERVSASEDHLRRLQASVTQLGERLEGLERGMALLDAGVQALANLLDRRRVIRETELMAAWERAASSELAREESLEKLRRRREGVISRARVVGGEVAAAASTRALHSAELALLAGQAARAFEVLEELARRFPRNPELSHALGELAFDREDLAAAERHFRLAVRWDPADVEARIYLGTLLADRGEEAEAVEHLERALAQAPESFLPHFSLGAFHAAAGRATEAREHLQRAIERDETPQALFLLGVVELEEGRSGTAVRLLQRAVELDDEFEEAIYYLGLAFLERGWHRRARECFHRVLEIDPQRLQYQEAVRLVETGAEPGPPLPGEAERLLAQASRAAEAGESERALAHLQQAVRLVDHPALLASLALLAAAAGRHRLALAAAHQLLRGGGAGAPLLAAWTALLETLRAARRFKAVERWGGWLLREGRTPLERAVAAYELALAELERGGDQDRALELAHESLEHLPSELRQHALAALGRIHLAREEYSDAVDYLDQAAALGPSTAVLGQLGLALLAAGEGDRAREVLRRLRHGDLAQDRGDMLTHLARVGFLAEHGRRRG